MIMGMANIAAIAICQQKKKPKNTPNPKLDAASSITEMFSVLTPFSS